MLELDHESARRHTLGGLENRASGNARGHYRWTGPRNSLRSGDSCVVLACPSSLGVSHGAVGTSEVPERWLPQRMQSVPRVRTDGRCADPESVGVLFGEGNASAVGGPGRILKDFPPTNL